MLKKGVLLTLACLLTACTLTPKPTPMIERYAEAKKELKLLFAQQEAGHKTLNFNEALARGLKYNLDYRIKLVNSALQAGQLDIAMFTMFPSVNLSGSVYSRNNKYSSSSVTSTGQISGISNSTPNTVRSARMGLTWNILDFGVGYVKARQQGDRLNIADEEARKQLQQLSQDVLVAYWNAYSAQQLMVEAREFEAILAHAKTQIAIAMRDRTIPKESILNYESVILDGKRRIIQLQYKYDKAMIDLKHLVNLPPDSEFTLIAPPAALRQAHNLKHIDFRKLDSITLVSRPELRGQDYQARIAKLGIKIAILQALPGITLNEGWNYNSNTFLLNEKWLDHSMDIAWNLLNLISLPTAYAAANTQVEYEKLKLMALTLSVLTETRYAYSHYESLRNEYENAHLQTQNAYALYQLNKDRKLASLASNQQVITAKLRTLTAKMDENLLLSDLSSALGELYLSVGSDILPIDAHERPLNEITDMINKNFAQQSTWNFALYVDKTYNKIFGNAPSYTIQLFGDYDLAAVKTAQIRLNLKEPTDYALTKNKGRDWYVLTYGKYTDAKAAKIAANNLQRQLQNRTVWVRKITDLKYMA